MPRSIPNHQRYYGGFFPLSLSLHLAVYLSLSLFLTNFLAKKPEHVEYYSLAQLVGLGRCEILLGRAMQ